MTHPVPPEPSDAAPGNVSTPAPPQASAPAGSPPPASAPAAATPEPRRWWRRLRRSQLTPAEIQAYVGTDFEHYYSEFPHHEFATLVWVNNA